MSHQGRREYVVFADTLTLKYGFENQPYGYCHEFPFSASDRNIVLKYSNGTKIWNYVNHADTNDSTDTNILNDSTDTNFLNDSTDTNFLNASFINNSLRMCFRNLARTDTGNYSLEEVKTEKRIYFFIDIDYEAKISSLTGDSNIEEYQETNFNCDVDSKPPANITWILPQNGIDDQGQNKANNSKLTFANCSCEHTGKYICLASNKKDTEDKKVLFLNVTCAPKFENKHHFLDTKINLSIGDCLEYGINFTSNPSADIITDGAVNVTSFSLDEVRQTLLIQKVIRDEVDFREYTFIIQNKLGVAKLVLSIVQQKIEISALISEMEIYWLVIGIASGGTVVLISLSVIVVCVWKKRRKKKTRKKDYNGDYKDNILYEPTPIEVLSGNQEEPSDTISLKSNDVRKCSATNSSTVSEGDIQHKKDMDNPSIKNQRRKPVPTPRNNKRILKTDLKNTIDSLPKEVSEATIPSASVQSDDFTFVQDKFQRCQEIDICKFSKDDDDGDNLQKHIKTKPANKIRLNNSQDTRSVNYIEVECPINRKSTVLDQSLNHRSNYYFMPNNNGVIVPLKSNDSKMCVQDDIDYQDDLTSASDPNKNMQKDQKDIGDVGICNRDHLIANEQGVVTADEQPDSHMGTSSDASNSGYIYRWIIKSNKNPKYVNGDDNIDNDYVNYEFVKNNSCD